MGKFSKLVERMPSIDDKEVARKTLIGIKDTLEQGIIHYLKKSELNDFWKDHYDNSVQSYRNKLKKVSQSIKELDIVSL